jgi:hypothetical protein
VGSQEEVHALLEAMEAFDPGRNYPACFPVFYQGI